MLSFTEEEWETYRKAHHLSENGKLKKRKAKKKETIAPTETNHRKNSSSISLSSLQKLSETEIQNQIRKFLRLKGWYVMRHQQSLGSLKGMSDLTAIKEGNTIYIEVKTPRGVQSKYQKEFQREIELHGGTYLLAKSVEDIRKFLIKNSGG